ncbi:MAG TPA: flagellar protein [Bradyrhizobium sp.]|nr:flagellar protein [Bradyrhizobium sp.]
MSVSSINYASSLLGLSVQNINNQLSNLSTQLSSGVKSSNYAGMGVDEGFAIAARSQLSNIAAFTTTMTNVNTVISAANTGLQSLSTITGDVQSAANSSPQNLTSTGQTIGQQNAQSELSAMVGILNTQVGNRYIYSGTAINTPAVASADDIMNGTASQAGLKQVIAERLQADQGANGMGRLVLTAPTPAPAPPTPPPPSATITTVGEDVAGSPFGLKLNSVTSSLTNATVTGPSGSPAAFSVDFAGGNPNPGDTISVTFTEPDGTTDSIKLTASSANPVPSGSFAIGATTDVTAANFSNALTSSISTLANTSLVAASAVEAGDNFFNTDSSAIGAAKNNQATPAAPITGATALSGTSGTNSLTSSFATNDTITVNGTTLTFVASGATGNQINVTDSVQTLLSKIDQITGTSTPSTVHGGAITINTDNASTLSITSSNAAAFGALGFSGTVTATQPPLRVPSPLSSATSLVNGSANTVKWYTGNSGPGSARSTATVRVDSSLAVQFGAQANEQALRSAIQAIATYAAVTVSPTATTSPATANALSQRVAANLTPQLGRQTIQDIQTDFATAQNTMKDATARQTQTQTALQDLVASTEGINQNQVASEILSLQNSLQASYQTTAMLSQLSLTKFLPAA